LLHSSGALEVIDAELAGRPGPDGLPGRTVLVGLLLSLHYHHSASRADTCRVLLDELRPPARGWLDVPDLDRNDTHARIAFSHRVYRVYRAFDRLTTALDPHRCERRRRLPAEEAAVAAAAWEDSAPEHVRRRQLLQDISDRLVLVTVRLAHRRGHFKGWRGDIGVDTTSIPTWHHEPSNHRGLGLGSVEITAGWHFSGSSEEGVFGYSATLLVAASAAKPTSPIPQAERLRHAPKEELPRVCRRPTITVHPGAWERWINTARTGTTSTRPGATLTGPSGRTPRASTGAPKGTASTSPTPESDSPTAASPRPSSSP
jgi:hypothetical protein